MKKYFLAWLALNGRLYRYMRKRLRRRAAGSVGAPASSRTAAQPLSGSPQGPMAGGAKPVPTKKKEEPRGIDYLGAFGLPSVDDIPVAEIVHGVSSDCKNYCTIWAGRVQTSFKEYFSFEPVAKGWSLRHTPMLIDLEDYADYEAFENYIKKFSDGERIRMAKRAQAKGYVVKTFNWNLFIPDIHAINTSEKTRSGGDMRGGYLRTVEEMGGPPKTYLLPPAAPCRDYWQHCFGVFAPTPGYKQGEIITDERLLAYFAPRRFGNVVVYSMLLGHGDHLAEGIMDFGHQHITRWIFERKSPDLQGLRYVMYGGMENGGEGLFQWKRRSGFKPYRVYSRQTECMVKA